MALSRIRWFFGLPATLASFQRKGRRRKGIRATASIVEREARSAPVGCRTAI